jgi:biopolymer transport protein ExbD
LKVNLPKAGEIEKIPRNHASTIYVGRSGLISIDDMEVSIPDVQYVMQKKLSEDFNMIACFRTDRETNYGVMSDVLNQLRKASALRVSFEARLKR